MSLDASGQVSCHICGHPVDQQKVLELFKESEGVVPVLQPFRTCERCAKAAIDGKLSNQFLRYYTTKPAP